MALPEIHLLQAAVVLAEELHFSRAADRLHMTQSTLSKQILKLERMIGFQVFRHNHQAAELTDAGRVFIAWASALLYVENNRVCRPATTGQACAGIRLRAGRMQVGYASAH